MVEQGPSDLVNQRSIFDQQSQSLVAVSDIGDIICQGTRPL